MADSAKGWLMMDGLWHCLGKVSPVTIMGQEYVIRRLFTQQTIGSIVG